MEGSIYKRVVDSVLHLSEILAQQFISLSVDDGALTQLYVATAPDVREVTGQYFIPVGRTATPSQHAVNSTLGQVLWDVSESFLTQETNSVE